MFGKLRKIGPVLDNAEETLEIAREQMAVVVLLSVVGLAASVLTLLAVWELRRHA